jgi:hypothetical protein
MIATTRRGGREVLAKPERASRTPRMSQDAGLARPFAAMVRRRAVIAAFALGVLLAAASPRPAQAVCDDRGCSDVLMGMCLRQADSNHALCRDACAHTRCSPNVQCGPSDTDPCCRCYAACDDDLRTEHGECSACACPAGTSCAPYVAVQVNQPWPVAPDPRAPMAIFGMCCPANTAPCGGQCVQYPCSSGAYYFDLGRCECACAQRACPQGWQQNMETCRCECIVVSCPSPRVQNLQTCECECPTTCPLLQELDPVTCQCRCPDPLTVCGGICVDTSISQTHCGACGIVCAQGEDCCNGHCEPLGTDANCRSCDDAVPQGWACCGGQPRPLGTRADCSRCGDACAGGKECRNGRCSCSSLQIECSGICRDELTDRGNCRSCGCVCPPGATCSYGACVCAAPRTLCGGPCNGRCVDTRSDPKNCGGCGVSCPGGGVRLHNPERDVRYTPLCESGVCICPEHWYSCVPGGTGGTGPWCAPDEYPVCCRPSGTHREQYVCPAGATCCSQGSGCCT